MMLHINRSLDFFSEEMSDDISILFSMKALHSLRNATVIQRKEGLSGAFTVDNTPRCDNSGSGNGISIGIQGTSQKSWALREEITGET